jgi:hypothetical protein
MAEKTIKIPSVTRGDSKGNITYEYVEIPLKDYEEWLKKCFELYG